MELYFLACRSTPILMCIQSYIILDNNPNLMLQSNPSITGLPGPDTTDAEFPTCCTEYWPPPGSQARIHSPRQAQHLDMMEGLGGVGLGGGGA